MIIKEIDHPLRKYESLNEFNTRRVRVQTTLERVEPRDAAQIAKIFF